MFFFVLGTFSCLVLRMQCFFFELIIIYKNAVSIVKSSHTFFYKSKNHNFFIKKNYYFFFNFIKSLKHNLENFKQKILKGNKNTT